MSLTIHHRSLRQKLDAKVGILLTAAIGVSSPMSAAGTPPPSFYPLTWPPCYGGSIFAGPRRFRGRDHGRQKFEIFRLPPFGANLGHLVYGSPASWPLPGPPSSTLHEEASPDPIGRWPSTSPPDTVGFLGEFGPIPTPSLFSELPIPTTTVFGYDQRFECTQLYFLAKYRLNV